MTRQEQFEIIEGKMTFPAIYDYVVDRFPSGSMFVEVGTYVGNSLFYLLMKAEEAGKDFTIFGVDNFIGAPDIPSQGLRERFYNNIYPFSGKYHFIEEDSVTASHKFAIKTVDFVFIDASHLYENIIWDIKSWYPKIKDGGIIAGHDYSPTYCGVIEAVGEVFGDKIDYRFINESCWMVQL